MAVPEPARWNVEQRLEELRRGDDRRSDVRQAKEVHVTRDERFGSGYAYKRDEELVVWVLDPLSPRSGRVRDLVGYAPEVAHEALGLLLCKPAAKLGPCQHLAKLLHE